MTKRSKFKMNIYRMFKNGTRIFESLIVGIDQLEKGAIHEE